MKLSRAIGAEFQRQVFTRALVISEARLKKEGVNVAHPMTGEPTIIQVCAWHALDNEAKLDAALDVSCELVARN